MVINDIANALAPVQHQDISCGNDDQAVALLLTRSVCGSSENLSEPQFLSLPTSWRPSILVINDTANALAPTLTDDT